MRRDSRKARILAAELARARDPVSVRQLERLDEFGLIGEVADPPSAATIERTREALRLVSLYGSGARAAIVMFFHGYDIPAVPLIKAYLTNLERLEAWLEKLGGALRGREAIERAASVLADRTAKSRDERDIRERIKRMRAGRHFMTMHQWLTSIYTDTLRILQHGAASSEQGLRELLEASDVVAVSQEALPGKVPPVVVLPMDSIKEMLAQIRLGRQATIIMNASYQQLLAARDDTVALVDFAKVFAPFAQRAFGLRLAYGLAPLAQLSDLAAGMLIPLLTVMRTQRPQALDELRETIDRHQPQFEAMNELLDRIPDRFYPAAETANNMGKLPAADRAELTRIINDFEADRPSEYALVMGDAGPARR